MATEAPILASSLPDGKLEQAFLVYCTFCGDLIKAAHVLGCTVQALQAVVEAQGWEQKLAGIISLSKSQAPGDLERAVNRAINFVQAHRTRRFLETVLSHLCDLPPERALDVLHRKGKDGIPEFSGRSIADFVTALEKCHAMTYAALGDTGQERSKRAAQGGDREEGNASAIFSEMSKQMAAMKQGPAEVILVEQQRLAEAMRQDV